MKNPPSNSRHGQPGIALIVVVSLIAMLTLLVLAFLLISSTNRATANTDASMRQAESIAGLARVTIAADIIGEMSDGSGISKPGDGTVLFDVKDPLKMVPSRAVKAAVSSEPLLRGIVKQSAGGMKFHPAGKARASDVSTAEKSVGGRFIAKERWGAPKLLPPAATLSDSQVPDWIYLGRKGSNPTTFTAANTKSLGTGGAPNPEYVVGRYAYQVYDVSGLLDSNVAGFIDSASADEKSRKGSLAWADLSVLPGSGASLTEMVRWRRTSSGNLLEDLVKKWGQPYGWLRTPQSAGRSDNLYLGRKDLLSYTVANPGVIAPETVPYLIASNREANLPSWKPPIDGSAGFGYNTDRDNTTSANRRVEGVRVVSAFTRRDGSMAKVGEPLMKTRFPLTKIAAFTNANAAEIQRYFNLTPVSGGKAWQYKGSDTPEILTLEQVASENREPDFFETLKAGLLRGSIGNRMDSPSFFNDTGRDGNEVFQILRIGASIIDQWDADDNPTVIQYGLTNPLTGVRTDDVVGVENLPYFHFLGESRFRRRDTSPAPNDSVATTFITFQLWNPHKNVADGKIAAGDYRVAFAGQSYMRWLTSSSINEPGYTPYSRQSPPRIAAFGSDYIEFSVRAGASSFSQPVYLMPGVAGARSSKSIDTLGGTAPVIGYNVGEITAPYTSTAQHGQRYNTNGIFSNFNVPITFALQKKVDGVWVTYQTIPEWSGTHGFVIGSLIDNTNRLYAAGGNYVNLHMMLADPRTTRYGLSSTTNGQLAIGNTTGNRTYDNKFFPPTTWTRPIGRKPEEFNSNATGGTTTVVNRDGIRRPADAGNPFVSPQQRPEILNRPFQSVADMGYAFRDDPWTSLNLFGDPDEPQSQGDGALLDLFGMTEGSVRGGVVNPNTAPEPVLESLLINTAIREGTTLSGAQAKSYAAAIRAELDASPMMNNAGIAKLAGNVTRTVPIPGFSNNKDRQVITRALADTANVRTWNLFIDLIAQSGKLKSNATGLKDFAVSAERHYWYHIAIDRFTGEIISSQRERVVE